MELDLTTGEISTFTTRYRVAKINGKGLVTDAANSVERADFMRRVQREPIFIDDSKAMLAKNARNRRGFHSTGAAKIPNPPRMGIRRSIYRRGT